MVPVTELVAEYRRRLDERLGKYANTILDGGALHQESAEATAIAYSGGLGRYQGLLEARAEFDELVKQANSGGL